MTDIPWWPHHDRDHPCEHVAEKLDAIAGQLDSITQTLGRLSAGLNSTEEKIMSGLTDLNTAVAAMQAEWATFLADLTTALANGDSDAAVEAAAQLVTAQTAAMQAADPVNPVPAPAPGA